jgi:Gas vesicle synthesis protein GvpL/GvpF
MASSYGLYAYGLVDKNPEPLAIVGIDKKSHVYPVEGKDSCVMVSEIDIDIFQNQVKKLVSELTGSAEAVQSGAEEMLQAHEDVVDALMKSTTVVPFQFGTILKDEQAALKMLQEYGEKFKSLLSKFIGRAEWGMKVYANQQEFMHYMVQIEPEFKHLEEKRDGLSRGAAYLLGRKMEEELKDKALARLAKVTEAIFHTLGKDAYEGKVNTTLPQRLTGKKKEMILNTVYLVEGEKAATFCKQGKRLMEHYGAMGLDLEVSGPWPPYSFTY